MKYSVQILRQSGYKIRVTHKRKIDKIVNNVYDVMSLYDIRQNNLQSLTLPKGGQTTIEVTTPDKKDYTIHSYCNEADTYNRRIGVNICIGRLVKQLNLQ
jgi:hypothetical protein